MNKSIILIFSIFCLFSCSRKNKEVLTENNNKVLMLKVDYLTNTFEGGKETSYPTNTSTFTITNQYVAPADFGNLKLKYQELNEIIFDGDIIWMGTGEIKQPQNILPATQFNSVVTYDIVNPTAGFENIFNRGNHTYDYSPIWLSVQGLVKVRDYLKSNPNGTVKIFLYRPSVGGGDPADWDWIIFMKN